MPISNGSQPATTAALLGQLVDRLPVAMLIAGSDGRILVANGLLAPLFGYTPEELAGQRVEALVPERFRPQHPGYRDGFFAAPRARPMGAGRDLYARRKDGSEFPVEIGLNPVLTDLGIVVLGVIVDISERVQREARIQSALRDKELLLGEVHHRVKNNLQVIHSLLDLQAVRLDDHRAVEMLRESRNRVKSMALIHQTLYQSHDFERVDFERFLGMLMHELLQSYAMRPEHVAVAVSAGQVHLPINAAIPCGLIVNELVANALKHGLPGGRRGRIDVELVEEADGCLRLSVTNDGLPIPESLDLESPATLGLQLVRLLAEQLGGTLQMQRADPVRFSLRFDPKRT